MSKRPDAPLCPWSRAWLALASVGLLQCTGNLVGSGSEHDGATPSAPTGTGGTQDPGAVDSAKAGFVPVPGALRKLTRAQYQNSVRDILGPEIVVPNDLEPDTSVNGYSAIAAGQSTVSPTAAEKLESAAYDLAAQAMREPLRSRLVTCSPAGIADEACAKQTLTAIGLRAFRRNLSDAERVRYATLAGNAATALGNFHQGLEFGIAALLQSLPFLYRVEVGEADPSRPGSRQYTASEMASRLSYLAWNSTPDAEFLSKVTAGAPLSSSELSAQVARLLASPRAAEGIATFHAERFSLASLDDLVKDQTQFPQATNELGKAMQQEVQELVRYVVFDQRADYRQLLTSRETFVNGDLAKLYGLPNAGATFTKVAFPADSARVGLLTTSAFLASNSGALETSPTKRGKFVRETLLCQSIPLPPPNVVTILPPDPNLRTKREKLAAHAVQPSCAACHNAMDPIGLGFEHFDALGQYRELDHGAPLDVTGNLDGTGFVDARGLAELVAASPQASECVVRNLYRYATAHVETEGEEPAITKLTEAFVTSGYRLDELVQALVVSPEFGYAAPPQE